MRELYTGDEAVARGAYEAGVSFASAYPGTPSTEILENIGQYHEITSEWAPNEKVALEAVIGAGISGVRSLAAMKHVGVNVASDPLMSYAYMGVNGGVVLVSADDPSMYSSQNEQDNRNYAKFAKIAMFEPSSSQECLDMVKEAYRVSETYGTIVLLRMTTRVCHSKSLVTLSDRIVPKPVAYVKDLSRFDDVPAYAKVHRHEMIERSRKLRQYSEATPFNVIEDNGSTTGIVTSGISYMYAKEVFGDSVNYLKLGFTCPLPIDKIRAFRDSVQKLYVIEELDPYLEEQLCAAGIDCIGKAVIPEEGELNPDIIRKAILQEQNETIPFPAEKIVPRPPTLCAGCPHRGFFYVLKQRKDTVMVGDIGCYALGGTEPLNAKDMAICMGSAFSVAHGLKKGFDVAGVRTKVVGIVGDSTFYHTGINGLLEVAYNKSAVICVILDNRITGMTGHQENPGTGYTLSGEPANHLDLEEVVKALGIRQVRAVNPLHLDEMKAALDWAYSFTDEPCVIITKWPCVLKKYSPEDKHDFDLDKTPCVVDTAKCIGCRKCLTTGCPALRFDPEAKKTAISQEDCTGCQVCAQVCPVKAISRKEASK